MSQSAALVHHLPGSGLLFFYVSGTSYTVGGDKVGTRLLNRSDTSALALVGAAVVWGRSRDLSRIPPGWEVLEVDGVGLQSEGVH